MSAQARLFSKPDESRRIQGGTSLRILNHLPRCSEHLDVMLWSPNPAFDWAPYVILVEVFAQFGLELDTQPDERMDKATKEAVLKSESIASQLDLIFAATGRPQTIKIKLEIAAAIRRSQHLSRFPRRLRGAA